MSDDYNFYVKRERPEEVYKHVKDYFTKEIISQYASSKSIMKIQEKITLRALEILNLKKKKGLILDAGCGPGFTAMYLKELGYQTVALDIISEFLTYYHIHNLNPILADMCFLPFHSDSFDSIISISAVQWVYRDRDDKIMKKNLIHLAQSFYRVLKFKSSAIIQLYPKSKAIMEDIGKIFTTNTDFIGNFVIDNPHNPKKRKIFLVLKKINETN